jgi:hypothetical protein
MGRAESSARPILLVGWRSPGVSFRFRLNGFACGMRALAVVLAVMAFVGMGPASASVAVPTAQHQAGAPATAKRGNITFGAGPATSTAPDGRTLFTYEASAGGSIGDHIAILNITHHPEVLRVYTVDVDAGADGGFFFPPRSAPRVGAGAWVAVGTPRASGLLHAKPRSTTILPIHLTVPANASPGDHAAAVIVSLTGLVKGKSGQRVNLEQRVATRVLIRVLGTLRPQLSIEHLHARYAPTLDPINGGSATVKYTVTNTGNAILSGTQQVSVHGMFGTTTFAKGLPVVPTLLPGGSFVVTAHVRDVFPEIRMTANVAVTPVALPGDVDPGLTTVTAGTHFWAIPWILIGIIVLILLVIGWRFRRWRRSRKAVSLPDAAATLEGARP